VHVLGIRWIGIRTDRLDQMVGFLRDGLGLSVNFDEGTTVELSTSDGDAIQVMGPGHPYHAFFGRHAVGPVPLLEVEDLGAARSELEAIGAEIVGSAERDRRWEWIHVRAPDGTLFELASRRRASDPEATVAP
jgi:catechol 2,3-dioxygenase-like lactoylglutathione lyase family enzyme